MEKFSVTGMSCAACQVRVEKAVLKVSGVTECSVNLLTNSMSVKGDASSKEIIRAVEKAGYGASKIGQKESGNNLKDNFENSETKVLVKRLCFSLIFLLLLMYVSMGHVMLSWPLPSFFNENYIAIALLELMLSSVVMIINQKFFISGSKALIKLSPNMDTLVALGSGISFLYSTVNLFLMTKGSHNELYFESAAMIVTLITVGKLLESVSKGKTTDALKSLMHLMPNTAKVLRDGREVELEINDVSVGDVFIVRPGESIPCDGVVLEGTSCVDESAITGESIPVDKEKNSRVSAATINQNGVLTCRVEKVGADTALSKIIQMVSEASSSKAPVAKVADKVSGVFVPFVLVVALITFVIWLIVLRGEDNSLSFALSRAISVLVISCPCALGLATPVAIMVGSGLGAKHGLLFKNAAVLEEAGKCNILALDKTGTITTGKLCVTDVIPFQEEFRKDFLQLVLSTESLSEHPIAKAVCSYARKEGVTHLPVENFKSLPGMGLSAFVREKNFYAGSVKFISEKVLLPKKVLEKAETLSREGKTPVAFCLGEEYLGLIALMDSIKDDSFNAINEFRKMGFFVAMITGDNENTAQAVGKLSGVDKVYANVLPEEKALIVQSLKKYGKVCMVGDGINDAPSLTAADVGCAIGAGTDVAIDAAGMVLVNNRLTDALNAIRLSKLTLRNIYENLFWAFFYNALLIPVAAGAYYKVFGLALNPMLGALAMSLSSFCVVTNALRLNLYDISKPRFMAKKKNITEEQLMFGKKEEFEKTIKVEGMMCSHCEAHVKEALEKVSGVTEADASHEKGEVYLKLSKDVPEEKLSEAVKEAGYTFVS